MRSTQMAIGGRGSTDQMVSIKVVRQVDCRPDHRDRAGAARCGNAGRDIADQGSPGQVFSRKPMSARWPMAGGVLLLLMGGLTAMTLPAAAADTGALRQVACWFKVPSSQTAICYRLAVPESRAAAGSAPGSAVKHEVGGGAGKSRGPP